MYTCKDCRFQLPSIKALCCHLRIIHLYNVYSIYKCAQNGCSREYNSVKSFRKHLRDKHPVHMLGEVPLQALHQEHLAEVNEEFNFNIRNVKQLIIMMKMNRLETYILLLLISRILYLNHQEL